MKHIILIGFMGAGKSSVGKELAALLGIPFTDTDDIIEEQAQMKIAHIFQEYGEDYFRDLETLTLRQLLAVRQPMVVAVGGGLPLRAENRDYLRQLGTVFYLLAETDTLIKRLSGDQQRPILQGGGLREKITQLMADRGGAYDEAADIKLTTDDKSCRQIAEEIKTYV